MKQIRLKADIMRYKFEIHEKDLREEFIKGFGPGGQKTNKSNNCVVLKHLPTGMVVKVHDSRDQLVNRKLARKLLLSKLDFVINGETSTIARREQKVQRSKDRKRRRREKKGDGIEQAGVSDSSSSDSEEEEDFS